MKPFYLLIVTLLGVCLMLVTGCLSDRIESKDLTSRYQHGLVAQGSLQRGAEYDANEPNDVGLVLIHKFPENYLM